MNALIRVVVVLSSLLIGMLVTVGHLPRMVPEWLALLRPEWMVLVCFFWAVELPERIGLVGVWLCGTLVDVLVGDAVGSNGACLAAVSLAGWKLQARMRLYSPFQEIALVFVVSLGVLWIKALIDNLLNGVAFTPYIVVNAFCTSLWWIPLSGVLRRVKTSFDIR
tara:strand:- start:632 stop:1126 length:495 start_codon:yes stop_codon:yes gene_type:complete